MMDNIKTIHEAKGDYNERKILLDKLFSDIK